MTIKELKELLEEKLEILEQYDEDKKIRLVSNTYFLGDTKYFLGVAGYNGGYLALDDLEEKIEEDEEDMEEEE